MLGCCSTQDTAHVLRQAEAQLDFPLLGAPLGRERYPGPLKPINSV